MWEEVQALVPPLVVALSFCLLVFSVLRREIGGKRRDQSGSDKKPSAE